MPHALLAIPRLQGKGFVSNSQRFCEMVGVAVQEIEVFTFSRSYETWF